MAGRVEIDREFIGIEKAYGRRSVNWPGRRRLRGRGDLNDDQQQEEDNAHKNLLTAGERQTTAQFLMVSRRRYRPAYRA